MTSFARAPIPFSLEVQSATFAVDEVGRPRFSGRLLRCMVYCGLRTASLAPPLQCFRDSILFGDLFG